MNLKPQRTNTILYCAVWSSTVAFYAEILGFPISFQNDWFVEFQLTDTSFLSVADVKRATIRTADGQGITLSWQVADIQDAHNTLKSQGVEITDIKEKWGAKLFYLHDPEGHRIELWQSLED